MSLGELQSSLFSLYKSVSLHDCDEKLSLLAKSQKGVWGYTISLFTFSQNDNSLGTYLKHIEQLFQTQMQYLLPILKSYETFLKRISEENIVNPDDFQKSASKIEAFYQSVHPFLVLLQKYRRGFLSEIQTRNIKQIFSYIVTDQVIEPFQCKQQPLLCRIRSIIALEGLYQGPLPYVFLKNVSRNYIELWEKELEDSRYQDGLLAIIKQINANSAKGNWIRIVTKGLRALVEHFQIHHYIEGTAKASLPGLQLAFYMTSFTSMENQRNWLKTNDTQLIQWRKSLKKGMKLHLNNQEIVLGERLQRKQILPQKKEDNNYIFLCENLTEKVVVIPQNQAMLFLLPLFRNTLIPLYDIDGIDPKGRFALIERLYPLKYAFEQCPLTEITQANHPIIKAFDDVTVNNQQPSNLNDELLLIDKTGKFKAIDKGEMIPLERELLEKVVLSLSNNHLEQYKLFVNESNTMRKLHHLCTDLLLMTLGFHQDDIDTIVRKRNISNFEDADRFCKKVEKLKVNVHHELLKTFDSTILSLNDKTISQIIVDVFYHLRAGPDLDRLLPTVCSKFIELSKGKDKSLVIFQFEAPY